MWKARGGDKKYNYPKVQLYCLMGTAGAYTDFHVDFGGECCCVVVLCVLLCFFNDCFGLHQEILIYMSILHMLTSFMWTLFLF